MNVLLIAEGAAGTRALQSLHKGDHRIVAVMSSPPGNGASRASVWSMASELGYPIWPTQLVKDPNCADRIRHHRVDIILNVFSLVLICKEVLEAPLLGSYNLHPGPLPRYAGLNSVCWAIYRGERTHGITLHRIEPKIDSGPIACQELFEVGPEETGLSLTIKCVAVGVPMMVRFLEDAGQNPPIIPQLPQDVTKREYFGREVPGGGSLSWDLPAKQIYNFVRACDFTPFHSPWGHPRTAVRDREFEVVRARLTGRPVAAPAGTVGQISDLGVEVACKDEWILVRQLLQGEEPVPAATILRPGDRLQNVAVRG